MRDPFEKCVASVSKKIGKPATFNPASGGSFVVRATRVEQPEAFELQGSRFLTGGSVFEIPAVYFNVSPKIGDQFVLNSETYEIKAEPDPDLDSLVYILDCVKI